MRFFGISRGVFRYLERLVSHNVTFRLLARLRVWFYEKLEPLAPARLMEYKSGDLLARVIGDVETLENFYVRVISPSLTAILIGLGVSIFFASFYPPIALVLIGFFLTLGFDPATPHPDRQPRTRTETDHPARRHPVPARGWDPGYRGPARLWTRRKTALEQIASTGKDYGSTQKQMARISGIHSALGTLFTNLGLWLVLFLVIPQVTAGNIKGVMLGTFALMTLASFEAVTPLPLAAQMWNASREAARRLFEVVDAEPAVSDQSISRAVISRINRRIIEFRITDLTFSYPNQIHPCTARCHFHRPAGKSIAIVGPSGAGKSTLANLLLQLLGLRSRERSPWAASRSRRWIRMRSGNGFALVSQNSYFFNTSIRENLRLARRSRKSGGNGSCGARGTNP